MASRKVFSKLIRDKMPEFMESSGKKCNSRIAETKEYREELFKKINEELEGFKEKPCAEQMAEALEALENLIKTYNIEMYEVFDIKDDKVRKMGSYEKGIILEGV